MFECWTSSTHHTGLASTNKSQPSNQSRSNINTLTSHTVFILPFLYSGSGAVPVCGARLQAAGVRGLGSPSSIGGGQSGCVGRRPSRICSRDAHTAHGLLRRSGSAIRIGHAAPLVGGQDRFCGPGGLHSCRPAAYSAGGILVGRRGWRDCDLDPVVWIGLEFCCGMRHNHCFL